MMKKVLYILLVAVLIVIVIFLFEGKNILQEGNPGPVLIGIVKVTFLRENIVEIRSNNAQVIKYLSKSSNGEKSIIQLMKEKGYTFYDQMGSGYFFKKEDGSQIVVIHKYFSTLFDIWYFNK